MNVPQKPIIFCDFDGVLCHDRFWRSLSPDQYEKVQEYLFRNNLELVNDWMRGKYSAEEINKKVSENTDTPYDLLWDVFVSDCEQMSVSSDALEKLNSLRSRYTVILVTGNMDCFSRFTRPATELDRYFDHISNSFEEGILKTDENGRIFVQFAEKHGVPIQSCYGLDDSKNVNEVFSELGGTACLVTKEQDILYHLENIANRDGLRMA